MYVDKCRLIKPISCNEDDYVMKVAIQLKDNRLRNLIVVNKNNNPVGVVSSVDLVNNIIAKGIDYTDILAKRVMTSPVFYANINDKVIDAYMKMIKHNTYSLPIVDSNNEFNGILTFTEAVRHLSAKEKEGLDGLQKDL